MHAVNARFGFDVSDYAVLYDFSVSRPEDFWRLMWEFGGVRGTMGQRIVENLDRMPGAVFFPDATLNFADNLLADRSSSPALIFKGEDRPLRVLTRAELYQAVAGFAEGLRREGIKPGDRVAGYLPNLPEAIVAALGAAAVGAVWSSCSPDFGVPGVLDRFGQIEPKVLVAADGYAYGGKRHDCSARVAEIVRALTSVRRTVLIPYLDAGATDIGESRRPGTTFVSPGARSELRFEPLPFNHPLYILYSSGTTGVPKCIVHGAGGTLVQHLKEHQLLCDIRAGDRVFYFTTCGWMMWNWLVSALASGATLVLYDGSPFYPDGNALFDLADATGTTLFGTSPKLHRRGRQGGPLASDVALRWRPCARSRRRALRWRLRASTSSTSGSSATCTWPRSPAARISSVSSPGGIPMARYGAARSRRAALGMQVEVFDEAGQSVRRQKGELVCTMPFPSMPVGFWNDPDGAQVPRGATSNDFLASGTTATTSS